MKSRAAATGLSGERVRRLYPRSRALACPPKAMPAATPRPALIVDTCWVRHGSAPVMLGVPVARSSRATRSLIRARKGPRAIHRILVKRGARLSPQAGRGRSASGDDESGALARAELRVHARAAWAVGVGFLPATMRCALLPTIIGSDSSIRARRSRSFCPRSLFQRSMKSGRSHPVEGHGAKSVLGFGLFRDGTGRTPGETPPACDHSMRVWRDRSEEVRVLASLVVQSAALFVMGWSLIFSTLL